MTNINVGDAISFVGATRVLDISSLKDAIQNNDWGPYNTGAQVDIAPTLKWRLGYQYAWASGPNLSLTYWNALGAEECAIPNVLALNALGTNPFSVNSAGNVLASIRPATAAELASMTPSNANALNNRPLVGAACCTYPAGLMPPFAFTVTCKIPNFQGSWPAIWMLPDDGSWPPEIDVLEAYNDGGGSQLLTTSLHSDATGWTEAISPAPTFVAPDSAASDIIPWPGGEDPSSNFISYTGVVYPDGIFIFYNGVCVRRWPMPSDCNIRWYMLIDNTVRSTANTGGFLATSFQPIEISDIGVWKMPAVYNSNTAPPPPPPPPSTTIPEILKGSTGLTITMSNGHVLTIDVNGVITDNGVLVDDGDLAVAYDVSRDPHGILVQFSDNTWHVNDGSWTLIPTPANLRVITANEPPPPPPPVNVTFTADQWTAIKAAFTTLETDVAKSQTDISVLAANVAGVQSGITSLNSALTGVQSDSTNQTAALTALKTLLGV